jgi:hypothetical protein
METPAASVVLRGFGLTDAVESVSVDEMLCDTRGVRH